MMELSARVSALLPCVTAHRRALHQIPEEGHQEHMTQAYLLEALRALSPDEVSPCGGTGVRAVFYGNGKGRAVAFRADMDALHIKEETGRAFSSRNAGMMHACGHDGHMAGLLGLATLLASRRGELRDDVVLLFQPAEETDGGAKRMIDEGALENPHVEAVYGMHMMPDIPLGRIGTCEGPLMAQTCEMDLIVEGRGAHGAMPHLGVDAVAAAGHLITLLQTTVARRIDPCQQALITIGRVRAGERRNVLADRAVLEGIVRTFSNAVYDQLRGYILADLRAVEEAFGVRCTFRSNVYYPCVENDPEETRRVTGILGERFVPQKPRMIAEDFSYYQLERPGVFVFCGCMDEARQSPLHSCTFDFDERAILYGLELFSRLIAFES